MRVHRRQPAALEGDAARPRLVEAIDAVEHRRLAGAVRADDREDLALADLEADVVDRGDAAEAEPDVLKRQHRLAGGTAPGRLRPLHALRFRRHSARLPEFRRRHVEAVHAPDRLHPPLAAALDGHLRVAIPARALPIQHLASATTRPTPPHSVYTPPATPHQP